MIIATMDIEDAFHEAIAGRPPEWKLRAIAGYSTRTTLDAIAADDRGNEREHANRHGLSHANTPDEREAWTFGFTWPDRMAPVSSGPSRTWRTGERVRITTGGRTVDGRVELASPNGISLFLCFDAILDPAGEMGGYVGGMAVMWSGTAFQDLAGRGIVELAEVEP